MLSLRYFEYNVRMFPMYPCKSRCRRRADVKLHNSMETSINSIKTVRRNELIYICVKQWRIDDSEANNFKESNRK